MQFEEGYLYHIFNQRNNNNGSLNFKRQFCRN